MMQSKVRKYIAKHKLLDKKRKHLVALSGGADSVCLLLLLKEMGYDVHAVHCNFHLRGEESDRDEDFCKQLCKDNAVELHLTHFDTKTYAELHKVSIEMAARDLRYNYFEQLRQAIDAEDIVVAHHRDDNVETFLMNVIRGTGIQGLQAIKPRNGRIIRPLLCLSREEIEHYLAQRQQKYVTDSSNLVDDVVRNKIRLNILPMLESINPAVRSNINKTIANVAEAVKVVDSALQYDSFYPVKDALLQCNSYPFTTQKGSYYKTMAIDELRKVPSPELALYHFLSQYGFPSPMIEQVYENLDAPSGRVWQTDTYTLAMDRGRLIVGPNEPGKLADKTIKIPESGIYIYNERAKISVSIQPRTDSFAPSKLPLTITIDADKVRFPLVVRRTKPGDRFQPFGMRGTRLVSDYLTDKKRNYFERLCQLVVEDKDGEIIWLLGERTSQKVACDDNTIKIMTLRYIIDEE